MQLRTIALVALALLATPVAHRLVRELRGVHTVGEVTELHERGEGDERSYEPEITFTRTDGSRDTLHGVAISPPLYTVGEQLDVVYDGDDAAFGSPLARWWPWLLAVATCLAVVFRVRISPSLRPQLLGVALLSGTVVIGSPDRVQARSAIGLAATALAALLIIALREWTRRPDLPDEPTLPRARVTSR